LGRKKESRRISIFSRRNYAAGEFVRRVTKDWISGIFVSEFSQKQEKFRNKYFDWSFSIVIEFQSTIYSAKSVFF
jgi:hypothetical protein